MRLPYSTASIKPDTCTLFIAMYLVCSDLFVFISSPCTRPWNPHKVVSDLIAVNERVCAHVCVFVCALQECIHCTTIIIVT